MACVFRHSTLSGVSIALGDRNVRCDEDSDKQKYKGSHRVSVCWHAKEENETNRPAVQQ
jgi:hypothetical protein